MCGVLAHMNRRRPRISLTGYLFLTTTVVLAMALVATGALWAAHHHRQTTEQYEQRALAMARSVASMPEVADALSRPNPTETLAPLAADARRASGVRYIMIADEDGIRHSHPQHDEIGKRVSTDPSSVLAGREWAGVEPGPAGLTLRARVPVHRPGEDTVIGMVSVGILESEVNLASASAVPVIGLTTLIVLSLGAAGSYVISRRIKAKTHGLEPREIAELLDGREALLHAIREGVLAVGQDGRVALANTPAREMLDLPQDCTGQTPEELGVDERVRDILHGTDTRPDRFVAAGGHILVCNRRPVRINEADGGVVMTLRDHTELSRLSGELRGVRTMVNGLRAQSHEFANRIHTASGMLELGAVEKARGYLSELSAATTRASTEISEKIGDVAVSSLVLAKSVQAAERGISLELAPMTYLPGELDAELEGNPGTALRDDVLLVVGNLVDNALEAAGEGGAVELLIRQHRPDETDWGDGLLEIRVIDSGSGIPAELVENIFAAGISTKEAAGNEHQGLGLALVRQACGRWGGTTRLDAVDETTFTAYFPLPYSTGATGRGMA